MTSKPRPSATQLHPDRGEATLVGALEYGGVVILALLASTALSQDVRYLTAQMNADTLWQAQYLWDLAHVPNALQNFQIAEVGNQLPDLALGWIFAHALHSWRLTAFAMMLAHFLLYAFAGALVVVAIVRTSFARAALATAGVLTAIVMLDVLLRDAIAPASWPAYLHYPQLFPIATLFVVGTHSGAYPLGLFAVVIVAFRLRSGPLRLALAGVFALTAGAALSDREIVLEIVLPSIVALATVGVARALREGWRAAARPALWFVTLLAATALALALQHGAYAVGDPILPSPGMALARIPVVVAPLLKFVTAHPNLTVAPLLLLLFFFAAPYTFVRRPAVDPAERERRWFLWTFALLSIVATAAFFDALASDLDGLRYVEPALFVIIPFFVALATQSRRLADVPIAIAVAAGAAAIGTLVHSHSVLPGQLTWRSAYGSCVASLHARDGIDAGLASYWVARPETLSSDFSVQVDSIRPDGQAMQYMNDASWFRRSIADPSRPPQYRFIVMNGLDQNAIVARFGQPDRTESCDGSPVLIYDSPTRLQRAVSQQVR
jgi:hypothetical protein